MNPILRFGFLSFVAIMLALATWLSVFLPAQVLRHAQSEFLSRTGRMLNVTSGAALRMSPSFGVALNDISVAGASALAAPVMQAKALFIPVSLLQAFGLQVPKENIVVETPIFTMSLNSDGRSNIILSDAALVSKSDVNTPLPARIQVTFQNGTFVYKDELSAKSFALSDADGLISVDEKQEITLKSGATLGGQRVHFQAVVNSLPRAFAEGSPFDFNLEGAAAAFGFSGRIVATKGIDLVGQATLDTGDAARLLRWLGVDLHGLSAEMPLSITSAVETQGPLILLKKAEIKFANMKALGDVSYAATGSRPSLTLALGLDELDTNFYSTAVKSLAPIGNWSDRPFDQNDMNALDVKFRIAANQTRFGDYTTGPAEVDGELKDGILKTTIKSEASGIADIDFDSAQSPPKLSVNLDLKNVEAKNFMPRFTGMNWLQGAMRLNASLNAQGASQAEMISTLNGNIEMQLDNGHIQGVEMAGLAAHLQSEAVSGWEGEATDAVAGNVKLLVAEGVATLQENVIKAPGVKTSQTGEIDILRQALNLEASLNLNRGAGKPMQIKVSGPWAKPNFTLMKSGN